MLRTTCSDDANLLLEKLRENYKTNNTNSPTLATPYRRRTRLSCTMETILRQAFLYYDRDGDGYLNLEDTVVVLRSANVPVALEDVRVFMDREYAREGETVTSVSWEACLAMAQLYSQQHVARAKVAAALGVFEVDNKQQLNVQELRHCLRALTPASVHVTGADVADFTLRDIKPDADGKTTRQQVLQNF